MAFIRKRGRSYYLVHNVREEGRIHQIHLACLGRRPRISDDVIRGVVSRHPFLRVNWEGLKRKVSQEVVQPFTNNSEYLRDLLGNVRSLHLDIADLELPLLEVTRDAHLKRELTSALQLLRSTLEVKLNQLRGGKRLSFRR